MCWFWGKRCSEGVWAQFHVRVESPGGQLGIVCFSLHHRRHVPDALCGSLNSCCSLQLTQENTLTHSSTTRQFSGTHYLSSRFEYTEQPAFHVCSGKSLGSFQVHHNRQHTLTDNLLRTLTISLSLSLSLSLSQSLSRSRLSLIVGLVSTLSIRNSFPPHACTF